MARLELLASSRFPTPRSKQQLLQQPPIGAQPEPDYIPIGLRLGYNRAMKHADHLSLLRPANLTPGGVWADLGAGSGAFTLALAELLGPGAEIYAVDKDRSRLGDLERAYRSHFATGLMGQRLHLMQADFSRPLDLPALDGLLMANALHFFSDQERLLLHIHSFLKPGGVLLLVEYDVDHGNVWVPHPLSFETFRDLAPRAGFTTPQRLATVPSSFLRRFYSAMARRPEGKPLVGSA